MGNPTPNFGYNRPSQGDDNWDEPVNANWASIDADMASHDQVAKLTTSDSSTNINTSVLFPWDTAAILDAPFDYDSANTPERLDITEDGTYEFHVTIAQNVTDGSTRTNAGARLQVNGSTLVPGYGLSGYKRTSEGHQESSVHVHALETLSAGDYVEVSMKQYANGGTVVPIPAGCALIARRLRR